jgi:POT family proton-dependent oligopeptide transporter
MRRHPPGLYVLFFTEMWERFGFYTMSALFVLYMKDVNNGLPFLQKNWSIISGAYLGTVYFTPFFGGQLADQKLGYRWPIILGAIIFAAGYFFLAGQPAMAVFGQGSADSVYTTIGNSLILFWIGLTLIVIGNGLFKPNISTLVGKLYAPGDPRLDGAYSIFYMGINVGALIAPWIAADLRTNFGYHVGFAVAGLGMLVSLICFLPFQRWLVFTRPQLEIGPNPQGEVSPAVQRQRHIALLIIFAVVALFWIGFKQNANTFPLWARDCTDRTVSPEVQTALQNANLEARFLDKKGMIAPERFNSVNPLFVLLFTPILVWIWSRLRARGKEPSTPMKIIIGMGFASLAFVVLAVGGWMGGDQGAFRSTPLSDNVFVATEAVSPGEGSLVGGVWQAMVDSPFGRVSMWYLLACYALITIGELCLSPIGLSLVSKLAAPKQRSTWMGGWFAATAVGGYGTGLVGVLWDVVPYSTFFLVLSGTSLMAGLILIVFYRRLSAVMPNNNQPQTPPPELPHSSSSDERK